MTSQTLEAELASSSVAQANISTSAPHYWIVANIQRWGIVEETLRQVPAGARVDLYSPMATVHKLEKPTHLAEFNTHCDYSYSYPTRTYFKYARDISERLINQIMDIEPTFFKFANTQGLDIDLKPTFLRRLSVSMVYAELCHCLWMIEHFAKSDSKELILITQVVGQKELQPYLEQIQAFQTVTVVIDPSANPKQVAKEPPPPKSGITFLKYPTRWLKLHYRKLNEWFLRLTIRTKLALKILPLAKLTTKKPIDPKVIHIFTLFYEMASVHYISTVFIPLVKRWLDAGYSIQLGLFKFSEKEAVELTEQFYTYCRNNQLDVSRIHVDRVIYETIPAFELEHEYRFFSTKGFRRLLFSSTTLDEETKNRLANAIAFCQAYRPIILHCLYYFTQHPAHVVFALEDDVDVLSVLKKLSPLVLPNNQSITSVMLPSCLPEYCETYDCVDVDIMFSHHQRIADIFLDQNMNARELIISGSLEWEESAMAQFTMPEDITQKIQASDFVLGLFHQPMMRDFDQKVVYDNLVVNMPDIYNRFLDEHPHACIIVKPHRADDIEKVKAYLPQSDRVIILPKQCTNQFMYNTANVVLAIHSTTVVHSLAHGVPVVCLYKYPDYTHFYQLIADMQCLATNNHDELLDWIRRFKGDPEFNASVLQNVHGYRDTVRANPASKIMVERVQKTLAAI